jgi:hypothetical protein
MARKNNLNISVLISFNGKMSLVEYFQVNKWIIEKLINATKIKLVDSMFTVHLIHYNLWKIIPELTLKIEGSGGYERGKNIFRN